ncbi:MAG: hypothetical protein JWN56_571 [Sphingobacteriales bacterium]|nr:hypothetical protein [Sphingobacteriales bacterium]
MKTYIPLVAFLVIVSSSNSVFGQQVIPGITDEPVKKTYSGLRSAVVDTSFKIDLTLTKPLAAFPFSYHLPTKALNEDVKIACQTEATTVYRYNMPIVRPDKTTKILIAKLNPNSPYSYNMPILKMGVSEE